VTLAIGRDFADVSPIRGVIHGGASHTLAVGVTVEPVMDSPLTPPFSGRPQVQQQYQNQNQGMSQSQSQN
jgi:hypothetical protein